MGCVYMAKGLGVLEIKAFNGLLISNNEYKSMPFLIHYLCVIR